MSYILTLIGRPEGVFSVIDQNSGEHVIPIFENEDDMLRYHIQLEAEANNPPLQIVEVPMEQIVTACNERNQKCVIITVDDMMIPPFDIE
tara:strand:- start:5838 stop:6107 length:270 start_codon:yes stop_codon:yes gene_type:complete